jgi:hypothetical protein
MSAELNARLALIPDRVEAGMEWLDELHPDWHLDVNASLLNMDDGDRCVLGQLASSEQWRGKVQAYAQDCYLVGMNGYALFSMMHHMGWSQPIQLGFLADDMLSGDDWADYINALVNQWFYAISTRQKAPLLPGMGRSELVGHGSQAA